MLFQPSKLERGAPSADFQFLLVNYAVPNDIITSA
jgi:hypothetical protein